MMNQKNEDYRFLSTIVTDATRVENVLCYLYLPDHLTNPINYLFFPNDEQVKQLKDIHEFSVSGEVIGFHGKKEVSIYSKRVFTKHRSGKYWGRKIKENRISAWPIDLTISEHFYNIDSNKDLIQKSTEVFWLTPSKMLEPNVMEERNVDGNVRITTESRHAFSLPNHIELRFNNHYRFTETVNGETISRAELVAEFEVEKPDELVNIESGILFHIDDLLMLVSLAERSKCACIGWEYDTPTTQVKHFRHDIAIPDLKLKNSLHELIEISHIDEFIFQAYDMLEKLKGPQLVRHAIGHVIAAYDLNRTIENSYLLLFSALESLVLYFRQASELEYIFTPLSDDYSEFSKYMKNCIHDYEPLKGDKHKKKRKMLYQKISDLNRISFSTAFKSFCDSYLICLDDLWPVCDHEKGISLSEIRHRLIHGDYFTYTEECALISAKENLQWILERAILSILGWPISKSFVSPPLLEVKVSYYKTWNEDRKILNKKDRDNLG